MKTNLMAKQLLLQWNLELVVVTNEPLLSYYQMEIVTSIYIDGIGTKGKLSEIYQGTFAVILYICNTSTTTICNV